MQPGAGEWGEFDYSRTANPTRKHFEQTLASLERRHGGAGLLLRHGGHALRDDAALGRRSHLLPARDIYGGTYRLLHKICNRAGITVSLVDTTDLAAVEAAIRPNTKLLWIESPGNPLMSITDIAACAEAGARASGILLGVDNTFASPGAHAAAGAGRRHRHALLHQVHRRAQRRAWAGRWSSKDAELFERLHFIQNATGGVMGPFESFLCSRGLKTLELRVREQSRTAAQLAEHLQPPSPKSPA